MIRINLIPEAKRAARGSSSTGGSSGPWLAGYAIGVILWVVVLGVLYFMKDTELQAQRSQNRTLEEQIQELRSQSQSLDEIQAELEQSYALESVVEELNKARTGPTRAMMELSRILSTGGGPTVDPQALEEMRRENPLAGFNRSWDVRRLWLTSFEEEGGACEMRGRGRTNEDVAEFLRRLALSELFDQVTLQRTEAVQDSRIEGVDFIGFELTCQVTY